MREQRNNNLKNNSGKKRNEYVSKNTCHYLRRGPSKKESGEHGSRYQLTSVKTELAYIIALNK